MDSHDINDKENNKGISEAEAKERRSSSASADATRQSVGHDISMAQAWYN